MRDDQGVYHSFFRPFTKLVKRIVSNQTQIQRLSIEGDHQWLEFSIQNSKFLPEFRKQAQNQRMFRSQLTVELCQSKGITDHQTKFYVVKATNELFAWKNTVKIIKEKMKQKYSSNNQEHQQKLFSLWKNLKPNEKLKGRFSDQWMSIGFQANDPATDFRGAGIEGLDNLHEFSKIKSCKLIFNTACNKQSQYFFCCAGIWLTILAFDILRSRKIRYEFWIGDQDQKMQKFQKLYNYLFQRFHQFWILHPNKSMMDFNGTQKMFAFMVKKQECLYENFRRYLIQQNN